MQRHAFSLVKQISATLNLHQQVFVPHPGIFPGLLSKQPFLILEENHDICIT